MHVGAHPRIRSLVAQRWRYIIMVPLITRVYCIGAQEPKSAVASTAGLGGRELGRKEGLSTYAVAVFTSQSRRSMCGAACQPPTPRGAAGGRGRTRDGFLTLRTSTDTTCCECLSDIHPERAGTLEGHVHSAARYDCRRSNAPCRVPAVLMGTTPRVPAVPSERYRP